MNKRKDKQHFLRELDIIRPNLPKQYGSIIRHKFKDIKISRVHNVKNHGTPLDWNVLKILADVIDYDLKIPEEISFIK